MDLRTLRTSFVDGLEHATRFVYGWITDNTETLGRIVYFWHLFTILTCGTLIVVSHVIYPVVWFQLLVFGIVALIWMQHVLLRTCICTALERRWLGKETPLAVDVFLEFFRIPVTNDTRFGVTILMSTAAVAFLGLELIARANMTIRQSLGFSLVA